MSLLQPMFRPSNGFGQNAVKSIEVELNLFRVLMAPGQTKFHYYIEIFGSGTSPPVALKKRICYKLYCDLRGPDGIGPVFDGDRTVYSHFMIDSSMLEGEVTIDSFKLPPSTEVFHYKLEPVENFRWENRDLFPLLLGPNHARFGAQSDEQRTATINNSRHALQGLNVAIRFLLASKCLATARAFFPDRAMSSELAGGVLLKRGYITHLRMGTNTAKQPPPNNLFLAMDQTCATFLSAKKGSQLNSLADICCAILRIQQENDQERYQVLSHLTDQQRHTLERVLRRFKIDIKRGPSDKGLTKSIGNLTVSSSRQERFMTEKGEKTVEEFFKEQWGVMLRYPNLPNVVTMGGKIKTAYPMELCSIRPGQHYRMKLDPFQQSAALHFQTTRPEIRFGDIKGARMETMDSEHERLLRAYGIKIEKEFVRTMARVLQPPVVRYRHQEIQVKNGQWNAVRPPQKVFGQDTSLASWAIVICTRRPLHEDAITAFCKNLVGKLNSLGVDTPQRVPPVVHLTGPSAESVKQAFQQAGSLAKKQFEKGPKLFLCVTDEKSPIYSTIKHQGDMLANRGVTTQCMVHKQVGSGGDQYLSNLALKINLKIGGLNHQLPALLNLCGNVPTMVVGVDLTHHNLNGNMKPSISGLVASMDKSLLKYSATVGVQPLLEPANPGGRSRSQEPIQKFGALLSKLLEKWKGQNPVPGYPRRMIIFRDGVSDGEFSQVLATEFMQAKAAVKMFSKNNEECKITYIVCAKNHRLRILAAPMDQDHSGNAPAGTVVDTHIGDPFLFDFFCQTQSGLKGTSRPTRYIVLKDECKFSADELQGIVNTICSGFQRATRSVGMATPAYYADIVAARAKHWLQLDDDGGSVASGSTVTQTADQREAELVAFQKRVEEMLERLDSLSNQMWWT